MRAFIREKKIFCGKPDKNRLVDYLEVDCFPYAKEQTKTSKGTRNKKETVSPPQQKNLNDKNAKRYLTQLANANFGAEDLHVTATYNKNCIPASIEDAEKEAINFLRRISYKRKKLNLPPLKYILVTEYSTGKNDEKPIRIHHHIIINGGLDRDSVEGLWCKRKKKGQKQGNKIGFINADRLQPEGNGVVALCKYLTKNPKGKKRWSSSQNLLKPCSRNNDNRYSKKQIENFAKNPPDVTFWEKQYKGYTLVNDDYAFITTYNEQTGWALYLKLKRKT